MGSPWPCEGDLDPFCSASGTGLNEPMRRPSFLLAFLLSCVLAQPVYLRLPLALLEGRREGEALAFYGLPYARAERFAPPKGVALEGFIQATRPGFACPQTPGITTRFGGWLPPQEEDCLNLNVFLPLKPPPPGGFPVMVYLHGGGFQAGSASEPIYRGTRLAAEGGVVVAPNYRLGPLGFLPWEGGGNYGLEDVLEALRFVRKSIGFFGGNPGNVTLFGESAGAMLTCTLLAVPEAKGLFHKAILQSGGCEEVRPLPADLPFGRRYAKERGCEDLACLRGLPLSAFYKEPPVLTLEASSLPFSLNPFKPHIDGHLLPRSPLQALREGVAAGIPLLLGSNEEEMLPFFSLSPPRSWPGVEERVKPTLKEKTAAVLSFYRARYPRPEEAYWRLETDRLFHCPALATAQAQGPYAPTYLYRFAFRTPDFPGLGSFHGLELAPLFGNFDQMPFLALFLSQKAREEGERMGRILRRYWVNFAYQDAPKGWPRWEEIQEGMALLLDLPPRPLPLSALDPGSCALFEGSR